MTFLRCLAWSLYSLIVRCDAYRSKVWLFGNSFWKLFSIFLQGNCFVSFTDYLSWLSVCVGRSHNRVWTRRKSAFARRFTTRATKVHCPFLRFSLYQLHCVRSTKCLAPIQNFGGSILEMFATQGAPCPILLFALMTLHNFKQSGVISQLEESIHKQRR